jgi:hypothetical protein
MDAPDLEPGPGAGAEVLYEPSVGDAVRANLEPSYVAYGAGFGLDPLIFEANIAPHFSLLPRQWHVALFLTPKIVLRMFAEESTPVKTPSYMPRLTLMAWREDRVTGPAFYGSLMLSHHSNGQAGPFFDADGDVNHEDGDFSTNFVELGVSRVARRADYFAWSTVALEWHPGFNESPELEGRYGLWRVHVASTAIRRLVLDDELYVRLSVILDEFQRSSDDFLQGELERYPLLVRYTTRWPSIDIGLFASVYVGHDYYNIWFDRMLGSFLVGLSGDLTSSLPRAPDDW